MTDRLTTRRSRIAVVVCAGVLWAVAVATICAVSVVVDGDDRPVWPILILSASAVALFGAAVVAVLGYAATVIVLAVIDWVRDGES